jgi:hypothetical protein
VRPLPIWRRDQRDDPETQAVATLLRRASPVEHYTAPRDRDWLLESVSSDDLPERFDRLETFARLFSGGRERPFCQSMSSS